MPHLFCVTAFGPAATRWFSFVMAANKNVYVSHGSYPLDSVTNGSFESEKALLNQPINADAVTRGREADNTVKRTPLTELYQCYQRQFPNYVAYGNVHSFVLHELFNKPELESLDVSIFNIIRNPINYINSHTQLVCDADKFAPELNQHYDNFYQNQFVKEFRQFEEHFSGFDSQNKELLGFVLSCYTIKRQSKDLIHFDGQVKNFLMEQLTKDTKYCCDALEEITNESYPEELIMPFISGGALNSHKKNKTSSAQDRYNSWSEQQKSIFHYIVSLDDLAIYEKNGYDLSFISTPSE